MVTLALLSTGVAFSSSDAETAPPEIPQPWFDTSDRDAVVAGFEAEFGAPQPSLAWDGDHGRCQAGTSTAPFREATLRRVNYYRAMAGVVADVVEDSSYSAKAQRAAMMMSAEGELTHDPAESFACYDDVGREGAANSNLYLGRNGPLAIDGYIEDPGDRNVDVGHRATILHPPTRLMGVGDVASTNAWASANALWVFDDRVFDEESSTDRPPMREDRRFVAWPPRGYVPGLVVHPRWSLTVANHDFSRATISLYRIDPGRSPVPIPVTVVSRSGAPGHVPLPTLVWEPEPGTIDTTPAVDQLYLVVVDDVTTYGPPIPDAEGVTAVVAATTTSFSYEVTILGREPSPTLTIGAFLGRITHGER